MSLIQASDCLNAALTARAWPAAVFCWRDGLGRPRKDGDRYPGGQRKHRPVELGPHEQTLLQRSRVVGWMHALNEKSATVIGQAHLLGHLHDPIVVTGEREVEAAERRASARYDALDDFVKLHRAVWGICSAQSMLKNQIATGDGSIRSSQADNAGAYRRLGRMVARVRLLRVTRFGEFELVPLHVLQRVAFDEVLNEAGQPDVNRLHPAELEALRLAADALLDRVEGPDVPAEATEAITKKPRAASYAPLFNGDRENVDDEKLHSAVERLRASIKGSA